MSERDRKEGERERESGYKRRKVKRENKIVMI